MWMLIILPSFIISTIIFSTYLIYRNQTQEIKHDEKNDINEYIYDKYYDIIKDNNVKFDKYTQIKFN